MMPAKARLLSREVLPHLLAFAALVAATLAIDLALHLLGVVWVGRYLGIPGVLLIVASFAYSLRKRKLLKRGKATALLRLHEQMAWAGSLLVLVHAGIHFNALLAWLAALAMMLNVGSGLTGKFLLERSRRRLTESRQRLRTQGLAEDEIDDRLYWDSLTFDVVKQWRVVHFPITLAFAVLALAHVIAVLVFWSQP
ncbi:MAG: hypothetical protein KA297_22210 [Kofleriaceae bacterium]|nr:hypothetical protein [Kofleriaceae bacterium]MBP6836427.1 hypothetical protein [Kofleriaceae bacterium]